VQEACDSIQTSVSKFYYKNTFAISPNPIQSSTLIEYTLQQPSSVTLDIFDLSGQVITVLINEHMQQGKQSLKFAGSQLKSGVYFLRLKTNEGIQTRKMIKL